MALQLIGAGLGRTGTLSLKKALERLGHGPCYYMLEVLVAPERARHWLEQAPSGSHARRVFEAHNRAVIDGVPASKLLVYRPGDGREPLCRFLDAPVPDEEFPHLNDTAWYRARTGLPPLDPQR